MYPHYPPYPPPPYMQQPYGGHPMPPQQYGAPPMMHQQYAAPPMQYAPPPMMSQPQWVPQTVPAPVPEVPQVPLQPVTLYVGKLPSGVDDDMILNILSACGPVHKWNRLFDKPFGFATFVDVVPALRCIRVLNDYALSPPAPALQVKAGTAETVLLHSKQLEEGEEADTKDAVVRERIAAVISGSAVEPTEGLSEIEKFRLRQAKRDREVDRQRQQRIAIKLREMQQRPESAEPVRPAATKAKAPPVSEEESESKRRRKQQVLAMLAEEPYVPAVAPTPVPAEEYNLNMSATGAVRITGMSLKKSAPTAAASNSIFANSSEDAAETAVVRTVVPIDYSEEEKQAAAALQPVKAIVLTEEQKQEKERLKRLIDSLPSSKEGLFAYDVDWAACQHHDVVERCMRSYVTKKVTEFLGEEEPSLINFILTKIKKQCHPTELLQELQPVFDVDAESFILKMWRMLLFSVLKCSSDDIMKAK